MADLGGASPLFCVKEKKKITEERKPDRESKTKPPPLSPLAEGLGLPLEGPIAGGGWLVSGS